MHLPNGHRFQNGKYYLQKVIGQGGFGITYLGVLHTEVKGALGRIKTDVPVCIKEYFFKDYCYREASTMNVKVHSETGKILFHKFKEKLIKEASILSDVRHPYIVNVLEVFEENNTAYIVMEYIEGHSLKQRLEREGVLQEAFVLKYIHQVGEALQFVHEKNILHLDIKPSNIIIDKNDNARLIDFGVSKRYDVEQQETSTTMLTLSKGFASIEQYDNEGTLSFSPRPDIYSLGATMYNLLTSTIPVESILRATKKLISPSVHNLSITPETEQVILKAMAVAPEDRYNSVAEMMEALDQPPEGLMRLAQSKQKTYINEGGETTFLYSPKESKKNDVSGEETILNPILPPLTVKSKNRKRYLIPILIFAFAVIATASLYFVYSNKTTDPALVGITMPQADNPTEERASVAVDEPVGDSPAGSETIGQTVSPGSQQAEASSVAEPVQGVSDQPEDSQSTVQNNESTVAGDIVDNDALYEEYLALGKSKMNEGDNEGALANFKLAREAKLTEEVLRLEQQTEENIATNRIAQYEQKMSFGNLTIVRKISNNLYGAVNDDWLEVIPCKYLNVGRAGDNRAFERNDTLFDIYDVQGKLVEEGVTYY